MDPITIPESELCVACGEHRALTAFLCIRCLGPDADERNERVADEARVQRPRREAGRLGGRS